MNNQNFQDGGANQSSELLESLVAAVTPYVEATGSPDGDAPDFAAARVYCSPFRIEVVHYNRGRLCRMFRVGTTGADTVLAELTAQFLTAGIRQVPERERLTATALVEAGGAEWVLLVDAEAGSVAGVLQAVNADTPPVLLFTLTRTYAETMH